MPIYEHVRELDGREVVDGNEESAWKQPRGKALRVALDWDDFDAGVSLPGRLDTLLALPGAADVEALLIGPWDFESSRDSSAVVATIVANAHRLVSLRALFLGEMVMEEQEISWIQQSDITPLLGALPRLESLYVRGGTDLRLSPTRHGSLRKLVIETGGLPAHVVRAVGQCDFPALEWLELWLGDDNYGANTTVADLEAILEGERFPALRHLGLRNSQIANDLARAVSKAPVVERLSELDLSLSTLDDDGAQALLDGQSLKHLDEIDLHYHYVSDPMQQRLRATGWPFDLSDPQTAEDEYDRYVSVSE